MEGSLVMDDYDPNEMEPGVHGSDHVCVLIPHARRDALVV
jgi:hypothetical protein